MSRFDLVVCGRSERTRCFAKQMQSAVLDLLKLVSEEEEKCVASAIPR